MTDWDNLEGEALDLALAQLTAGEGWTAKSAPPYHASVDASIRDLAIIAILMKLLAEGTEGYE